MRVRELMERAVKTVGADTTVGEAIVTLADSHISALPVVDSTGRMVGVVSSTDILVSESEAQDSRAREVLVQDTLVRDIMTLHPLTVSPDTEIKEAAQQMLYAEVHRLFVIDGDRVVGVISTSDIMRAVANGQL